MKLRELKDKVYQEWVELVELNDAIVQPETFKPEVRRAYGDLRRKATWQAAYAAFRSQNIWHSGISEHTAIVYVLNFTPEQWDYEFRHQILEQYLAIPGALEFIARGLEQIYRSNDREDQECANGLLAMVEAESGRAGRIPTGSVRQFTSTRAS